MKRQVYLESAVAEKNGTRYSFDYRYRKEREFKAFQFRDTVAVHTVIAGLSPYCWLRWADKVKISPANINLNDDITSVVSSGEAGITMYAGASGIKYTKIGENYAVRSEVQWYPLSDSSTPQPNQNKIFSTFYMIFQTPATLNSVILWKDRVHRVWTGSVIKLQGKDNTSAVDSTCALAVSTPYLLQLVWDDDSHTSDITLINLLDNSEQVDSVFLDEHTTNSENYPTSTNHTVAISTAQTGFNTWTVGEVCVFNTAAETIRTPVINYMKALYAGGSVGSANPVHALTMHSEFLSDTRHGKSVGKDSALQIVPFDQTFNSKGLYVKDRSAKYDCDQDRLDIIDIYWTKPDGTEVECDFTVCLDLLDDVSQL